MGVFVYIEGAFDCASFQKFCDAGRAHAVYDSLDKWIYAVLSQKLLHIKVNAGIFCKKEEIEWSLPFKVRG